MNKRPEFTFTLFVCGDTVAGSQAIERVIGWSAEWGWQADIVDVQISPEIAEQRRILATPTLIREQPKPERRVVGDLRDAERVFQALSVTPTVNETSVDV